MLKMELEKSNNFNSHLTDEKGSPDSKYTRKHEKDAAPVSYKEPLSTKKALEFLLEGSLRKKVCRYCLNIASPLSELDQVLQVAGQGVLYKVSIRDMVASFYPFKVTQDPNFPNRICNKCLDRTISAYLFTQQCEQSERALYNCFEDISVKLDKLDPLERTKKRGRQKKYPNYNVLYAEHQNVVHYADPVINIINTKSVCISKEPKMSELECPRCWELFPNIENLIKHERMHPPNMWYNCRLCGRSFVKHLQLKRHLRQSSCNEDIPVVENKNFYCNICGNISEGYSQHLQHIEKHNFQILLEHLLHRKMDKLCTVCLSKKTKLVDLNTMVQLHGGYPGLGEHNLYSILKSILPEMSRHNYTGTKICEQCLNHAITAYVFITHSIYTKDRLNTCISSMLDHLNQVDEPKGNIFVEISKDSILPIKNEIIDECLLNENDVDEAKLPVDVLEDEFRIKSDSSDESDLDTELKNNKNILNKTGPSLDKPMKVTNAAIKYQDDYDKKLDADMDTLSMQSIFEDRIIENPAKTATKKYTNKKLVNGYQSESENDGYRSLDDVSEFLTFRKKKPIKKYYKYKFNCPMCAKNFVTDFHLQRHVLKHVNKKVDCYVCKAEFKSKFFLYEHIKIMHILDRTKYWACNVCGRTFISESKLKSHEQFHLSKECQLCDKVFFTQKHYDIHMQRHAVQLNLTKHSGLICSFCEKDFSDDNKLSLHVNKAHLLIKPYSCDMCERQFYTENNLKKHKKIHSLKTREACELCKKKFTTRKSMVIHLRKHTGETPHRCPLCAKAFYSELKAKNHMKNVHGGIFYCRLCKNVFSSNNDLKTHVIMIHNSLL